MTTNVSALSGARQQGPPANISGAEPAASATGPHWVPTVPGPGSPAPTAPPEAPPLAMDLKIVSPNTAAMPPPGVCLNIMEARQRQDGYGCLANPERFLNQDYQQLEQYCNIRGVRYIDDMFPPDRRSIGEGILKPSDLKRVVWLRPAKIAPYPAFVLDGVCRFDFEDCWFLASIGALTFQKDILCKVVLLEQTFNEKYCGMFHFRVVACFDCQFVACMSCERNAGII
ncbi:hypothetical protein NQZ68_032225 [Dissostichus eleginoides]|nr:hypothetical protein NQZ68_032225 [Dissostichus eleginoides]